MINILKKIRNNALDTLNNTLGLLVLMEINVMMAITIYNYMQSNYNQVTLDDKYMKV